MRRLLYNNSGDEMKIFLWLLAAAFLAAGIYQKEYTEVLNKAILICLAIRAPERLVPAP